MSNPFCHIELHTDDTGKSKSFYSELFNWKLEDMPMGDMTYTMVNVGEEGTGGGIMSKPCEDAPTAWMPYVLVEDVKTSAEKATSLGASIVKEETGIWAPSSSSPTLLERHSAFGNLRTPVK